MEVEENFHFNHEKNIEPNSLNILILSRNFYICNSKQNTINYIADMVVYDFTKRLQS